MSQRIAALDLGNSKAACLVAERGEHGVMKILAAGSVPCRGLKRGSIVDLEEASESINEVLRDVQEDLDEPIESVILAVGGPQVFAQMVGGLHPIIPRSRPITRDDVMQVVNHSRRQVLPPDQQEIQTIPHDFSIDGQKGIRKPLGMSGSKLEVRTMLISGNVGYLQNLSSAVSMGQRKVDQFVLRSMASGLGVLSADQLELGTAVIDLGAGTTELGIFMNGSLAFSASIPIGAGTVSSDISKLLKTSPEEAERLKLKFGTVTLGEINENETVGVMQLGQIHERPLQRHVLCEIIDSRVREIATLVSQQIEKSGYACSLTGGIALTGGGSLLPGIDDLFKSLLPDQRIRKATPGFRGKSASVLDTPGWATAVGLARYALNSNDDELTTAESGDSLTGKIKTIWSLISGRS